MKRLRFILHPSSFILCLLLAFPAFGGFSGLPDGVKANLPAIKKYPKASSILLWVKDSYTQNEDRSQVYERHEFRYLADDVARDTWGDPRIAYVEGRQKLNVITARTYTSDGRTIDATPNAFNPVTPDELDHAPDFSHFHQMVVTLLGLENGSIAELNYKLTTEQPLYPWLWGRVYFREEVPTIARELSVQLPGGQPLNFKGDNGAPEPLITGSTYIWRMGEQRGYLADDLRGHRVLLPNVAFTTAKDWSAVITELRHRVETASDHPDLPTSLAQRLVGVIESENKLDSIKTWARERFNEIEFDHPDFMTSVRPASQVLNSGYGNSLELAVLVCSHCSRSGVDVNPIAWFEFEPPVPYLYNVSGGLLDVHVEYEQFICDPLAPRTESPAAELSDASILLLAPSIRMHEAKTDLHLQTLRSIMSLPENLRGGEFRVNLNIAALDADTLQGMGTLFASGWQTPYEALRADPPAYLQELLQLNGLAVASIQVKQLVPMLARVSFAFTASALDTADESHILSADVMNLAVFAGNPNISLEEKEFPQWAKHIGEVSVKLEAPLPDGWSVTQQLPALTRTWKDGSGSRTVNVKDGRFILEETLTLGSAWIPPQDWGEFSSFLIETGDRPNNIIVFSNKSN